MNPGQYNHKANQLRMDLNNHAPLLMWNVLMFNEYMARQGQEVISNLFYVRCRAWVNGELFSMEQQVDPYVLEQCKADMPERIAARAAAKLADAIVQWRK